MNRAQKEIWEAIRQARMDAQDVVRRMPDEAQTPGQNRLKGLHGTPKEFAISIIGAIGDLSVLEVHRAIRDYYQQWINA